MRMQRILISPAPHMFGLARVHYHGHRDHYDHYQGHVSYVSASPQIECGPRAGLWLARWLGPPANQRREADDEADDPHQADQHLGPEKAIRVQ